MALPFAFGAVQVTVAAVLPAVALTPVGAKANPNGITLFEAPEGAPTPAALVAVTVKV